MERIRLKLKAYDHRVLDGTVLAIVEAVKRTGADVRGPVPMPTKIKRYTVLKSPHINKDSREQFEMKIHARMLDIVSATSDTVDSLTNLNLAPEVNVEVRALSEAPAKQAAKPLRQVLKVAKQRSRRIRWNLLSKKSV